MLLGRLARIPLVGFIELFRGLPVVITIFYVWRVLPDIGVDVGPLPGEDGLWYVVIGLTLYNSVIIAEIVRAGVDSLPGGQGEAALAIGMTPRPGDADGAAAPGVPDHAAGADQPARGGPQGHLARGGPRALHRAAAPRQHHLAQNLDNPIQVLFVVGLIYILINYALSRLATWLERRLSRARGGKAAMQEVEQAVPLT